jgi:hypothetical protein
VDVDLERGNGGAGRLGAPDGVDQPVARHHLVRVQEQEREQGALLRCSQWERALLADDLDRAEDAEFDACRPPPKRAPSGS